MLSKKFRCLGLISLCAVVFFQLNSLFAELTSKAEAQNAVLGWLKIDPTPLDSKIPNKITGVKEYKDAADNVIYYVVSLTQGYVVVSSDDLIEPIIAFSPVGKFDPNPCNPMYALLGKDMPERFKAIAQLQAKAQKANQELMVKALTNAKSKWDNLLQTQEAKGEILNSEPSIDDVRVPILVDSRWSQSTESGSACYNYYTPTAPSNWTEGDANNYVCGCVATAMAQLMRYYQHPVNGVGTSSYSVTVDDIEENHNLRGGDGNGGAYDWANMVLDPDGSITVVQRQAIGALCADAGVAAHMMYSAGESGAYITDGATALKDVFNYSNAVFGYNSGSELVNNGLNEMVNPNLDAGFPVLFGIVGDGGHAIVCDGYGYNTSTLYHHLNMGWAGNSDAWYNLPDIGTAYNFNKVSQCVYNIFVSGTGEIISGRVVNGSDEPIAGFTVTANDGVTDYTDTSNSKGIYAIRVPSATSFTLSCPGATSKNVTTGTSADWSNDPGNLWAQDFTVSNNAVFAIDDKTVTEGDAGTINAVFTVTMAGSTDPVTVDYATADNTATAGSDYVATSGTLSFDADGTKTITVTVNGDTSYENDETFYVNLSNPSAGTIDDSQGVGTITNDDDEPTVSLAVDNANIAEDGGVATFTATLSAISGEVTTVGLAFSGTATGEGTDYTPSASQIVIPAGDLTGTMTVTAVQDTPDEENETVIVDIDSVTNGTEDGDQQATTTINDDDDPPTISIDDVTVTEGDSGTTTASFTVSLSTASGKEITVDYATADGTAVAGTDYTAVGATTLTFAAGDTTKTVDIAVIGDTLDENDETFDVGLSNPVNATIADATGVCTITDDDTATFSVDDISVTEGDADTTATFTVSLSCKSTQALSVDYATSDGTATAGADYTAVNGTLNFAAGDTSKTVDVPILGDLLEDGDENFNLDLSNPIGTTISDAQGVCTIIDNEKWYTLTYTADENGSLTGDTTQTDVKHGTNGTAVTAVADKYYKFSKWSDDSTDNPRTDTNVTADISVTATFEIDETQADKLTKGSVGQVDTADIAGMDDDFSKRPQVYGQYTDPLKDVACTAKCKTITKVTPLETVGTCNFEWTRLIKLYDKKVYKTAQKGGTATATWLTANPMSKVICKFFAKTVTADGTGLDEEFSTKIIMPPQITSIERWDGGDPSGGIHVNSLIVIKGKYFGTKLPIVCLEYTDSKGALKLKRLKVQKVIKYDDCKGRAEKSCMNVETGASQIYVEMPEKMDLTPGDYSLILDNKMGIATETVTLISKDDNTDPVANDDDEEIVMGDKSYLIDVLANDEDEESDNMILSTGGKTSMKGGKICVSKGKIKYSPPRTLQKHGFTDTFYYKIDDGIGQRQGAMVTITIP